MSVAILSLRGLPPQITSRNGTAPPGQLWELASTAQFTRSLYQAQIFILEETSQPSAAFPQITWPDGTERHGRPCLTGRPAQSMPSLFWAPTYMSAAPSTP